MLHKNNLLCPFTALSKAVFSHDSDPILNESEFHLDRIDFMVKRGQLIGIIGKVGSGKSSLLASILGELNKVSGMVAIFSNFSLRKTKKNYKVQINIFFLLKI